MIQTTRKTESKQTLNNTTLFKYYNNPYNISYNDYKIIAMTFGLLASEEILHTPNHLKFPLGLGLIGVVKRNVLKRGAFDFQLFKETGEKRFHQKKHSLNYVAEIVWRRQSPLLFKAFGGCKIFKFKAARHVNRTLAKLLKTKIPISTFYHDSLHPD